QASHLASVYQPPVRPRRRSIASMPRGMLQGRRWCNRHFHHLKVVSSAASPALSAAPPQAQDRSAVRRSQLPIVLSETGNGYTPARSGLRLRPASDEAICESFLGSLVFPRCPLPPSAPVPAQPA